MMIAKTIFSLDQLYSYPGPDILQKGIRNIDLEMLPLQISEFRFFKEKQVPYTSNLKSTSTNADYLSCHQKQDASVENASSFTVY